MISPSVDMRPWPVAAGDLLLREETIIDEAAVAPFIRDARVFVTGGGGSIGSELCRQLVPLKPASIVIFDIYENTSYELYRELEGECERLGVGLDVEIGSIRDTNRLKGLFSDYRPEIVFHAAAHKHVPLMERSPCEAVLNNVVGTWNTAMVARDYGVGFFVLISTDKAVRPTSVMGATKRVCELVVRSIDCECPMTCAVVRFGNVLGSHGSVLPLFAAQMRSGGPVKVTHEDVKRFFMTIPEAARLVISAAALAKGGEVFLLDMGKPVRIRELAERFIRLSGYSLEEMPIEIIGLRPGEKLYEELVLPDERLLPTTNPSITVCVEDSLDLSAMRDCVESLERAAYRNDAKAIRSLLADWAGLHVEKRGDVRGS